MDPQPGIEHEKKDVEPRAIVRFVVVLLVALVIVGVLLVWLVQFLAVREVRGEPSLPPMANLDPGRKPPEPRLQEQPFDDYEHLHAEQAHHLESYGWADANAGVAHIPIDAAMQLLLQRGLPVRAAGETPAEAAK